jgi:hypothetical protein
MPISVHHTIKLTENVRRNLDPSIYRTPIADPPPFHVGCTCQWEAWAHSSDQANYYIACHRQAQLMRGNIVTVILPQAVVISQPEADQPTTEADAAPELFQANKLEIEYQPIKGLPAEPKAEEKANA